MPKETITDQIMVQIRKTNLTLNIFALLVVLISSCGGKKESFVQYHEYKKTTSGEMTRKDTLIFDVGVEESDVKDVQLEFRINSGYKDTNICFGYEVFLKNNDDVFSKGYVDVRVVDDKGGRLKSGMPGLQSYGVPLCRLYKSGLDSLIVKVFHSMDTYAVYGVEDVGVKILANKTN